MTDLENMQAILGLIDIVNVRLSVLSERVTNLSERIDIMNERALTFCAGTQNRKTKTRFRVQGGQNNLPDTLTTGENKR